MHGKNHKKKILIVDDEKNVRESLALLLKANFEVETLSSGEEAIENILSISPDIVFLDVFLPGLDGIDTLKAFKKQGAEMPVIMLSGSNTVKTAVEAMKLGAIDYLNKPFDVEELTNLIIDTLNPAGEVEHVDSHSAKNQREIIGNCIQLKEVLRKVQLVAPHETTVLITGESGTGKELIARRVHEQSLRKDEAFIPINCAAIPENLIESELFGHEKGSFTNAFEQKIGLLEQADAGTIFLDELGELPLNTQVKLLRFLQEREFYRVGGTESIKIDVRIITATNKDLEQLILEKRFREDLYYRINVINLRIPALRERGDDVRVLLDYLQVKFSKKYQGKKLSFCTDAIKMFMEYPWPGNVRELENTIESLYALVSDGIVEADDLPAKIKHHSIKDEIEVLKCDGLDFIEAERKFETEIILKALQKTNNVQTRAADLLGITRRMLKYKMDKLGIHSERC